MTKSYFSALLALSGEPAFDNARSLLIQQLNGEELSHVIEEASVSCADQQSREALAVAILDHVAKQRSASATSQSSLHTRSVEASHTPPVQDANIDDLALDSTQRKGKAESRPDTDKDQRKHSNKTARKPQVESPLIVRPSGMYEEDDDQFLYNVCVSTPNPSGELGWQPLILYKSAWAQTLHAKIMQDYGHLDLEDLELRLQQREGWFPWEGQHALTAYEADAFV